MTRTQTLVWGAGLTVLTAGIALVIVGVARSQRRVELDLEAQLDETLEASFPASDPPSTPSSAAATEVG